MIDMLHQALYGYIMWGQNWKMSATKDPLEALHPVFDNNSQIVNQS